MSRDWASLREGVLDAMDVGHRRSDGSTPDHIIVSNEIWCDMKAKNRFERLRYNDSPKRRAVSTGYIGMRVWPSRALDDRGLDALLLSEEAFLSMMPTVSDYQSKDF